jgi:hypothetical protein
VLQCLCSVLCVSSSVLGVSVAVVFFVSVCQCCSNVLCVSFAVISCMSVYQYCHIFLTHVFQCVLYVSVSVSIAVV